MPWPFCVCVLDLDSFYRPVWGADTLFEACEIARREVGRCGTLVVVDQSLRVHDEVRRKRS